MLVVSLLLSLSPSAFATENFVVACTTLLPSLSFDDDEEREMLLLAKMMFGGASELSE